MVGNNNMIYSYSAFILTFVVAKGTYANLAQARTTLAGTKIWYELANPIHYAAQWLQP